jgi:hypothetical protein
MTVQAAPGWSKAAKKQQACRKPRRFALARSSPGSGGAAQRASRQHAVCQRTSCSCWPVGADPCACTGRRSHNDELPAALCPPAGSVCACRNIAAGSQSSPHRLLRPYRTAATHQGSPAGVAPSLRSSLSRAGRDGPLPPVRSTGSRAWWSSSAPARRPTLPTSASGSVHVAGAVTIRYGHDWSRRASYHVEALGDNPTPVGSAACLL